MAKIKPGLVSVTFRKLSPEEIIGLCKKAGISAIEWGSDVHAKDAEAAKKIAELMTANDMQTVSLGSYYKAGTGQDFAPFLEIALALGAPNIRIWAGEKNPEDADASYRASIIRDTQKACDMAAEHNIDISFEYHGNTLTNTQQSALLLLSEVDRKNVYSYWQPLGGTSHEQNLSNVKELCDINKLKNIHAYYWTGGGRLPLGDGRDVWKQYFDIADGHCDSALLEFVINDEPAMFLADAASLKEILGA